MITVSEIQNKAPMQFKTKLQEKVYRVLVELQIPYGIIRDNNVGMLFVGKAEQ